MKYPPPPPPLLTPIELAFSVECCHLRIRVPKHVLILTLLEDMHKGMVICKLYELKDLKGLVKVKHIALWFVAGSCGAIVTGTTVNHHT